MKNTYNIGFIYFIFWNFILYICGQRLQVCFVDRVVFFVLLGHFIVFGGVVVVVREGSLLLQMRKAKNLFYI